MYLHLGGNAVVRVKDVVAILNVERKPAASCAPGPETTAEDVKSVVITTAKTLSSPISSGTLKKRAVFPAGLA